MAYQDTPTKINIPHTPSMIRNNLSFDMKNQIVRTYAHTHTNNSVTILKTLGRLLRRRRARHEESEKTNYSIMLTIIALISF